MAAYLLYTASRWIFAGDVDNAVDHAHAIYGLEQSTGTALETAVQALFDQPAVAWALANVYLAAQLVVLPAALLWLYRRSSRVYATLRDTVLATWLLAVPVFAAFPVAPPRLAGLGLADTVSHQAAVALTGHSTVFYNPFAAVPSLHVGFAFAVGIALAAATSSRWVRTAALLWGPLVTLAVVATGNHFVFDVLAGLLVTAIGYLLGHVVRHRRPRLHRPQHQTSGACIG